MINVKLWCLNEYMGSISLFCLHFSGFLLSQSFTSFQLSPLSLKLYQNHGGVKREKCQHFPARIMLLSCKIRPQYHATNTGNFDLQQSLSWSERGRMEGQARTKPLHFSTDTKVCGDQAEGQGGGEQRGPVRFAHRKCWLGAQHAQFYGPPPTHPITFNHEGVYYSPT